MSDIPKLPEPTSTNPNPTEHLSGCSSDLEDGLLLAEGLYALASRATLLAYRDEMEGYLPNRIAAEELRQVNERLHSGDYYEEGDGVCLQAMTDNARRHPRQFHPDLVVDLEASGTLDSYVQTQIDRTDYEMKMLTEAGDAAERRVGDGAEGIYVPAADGLPVIASSRRRPQNAPSAPPAPRASEYDGEPPQWREGKASFG